MKIAVCVSGGGTNLQAIIDAIDNGTITNTQIEVVISNNADAYALERAKKAGIKAVCISPKSYESRAAFNEDFLKQLNSYHVDLVVLAGFLVVIPPEMIKQYRNRIINIHPSLIPSFCGTGYYGLKVHEGVLARGVRVTGATCHFVDEGTDTGPIILQKAVEVKQGDTPEVLQRRIMEQAEWQIMPKVIDLIAHVHWHTNRTTLICDSAGYSLPDPPGGICAELVTSPVIKFFGCPNKADIAFLNEIEEGNTTAHILFCYTDDQSRIRSDQMFSR